MKIIDFWQALGLPRSPWDKTQREPEQRQALVDEYIQLLTTNSKDLKEWIEVHEATLPEIPKHQCAERKQAFIKWNIQGEVETFSEGILRLWNIAMHVRNDVEFLRLWTEADALTDRSYAVRSKAERLALACFDHESERNEYDDLLELSDFFTEKLSVIVHRSQMRTAALIRRTTGEVEPVSNGIFKLPPNQEFFTRKDIHFWATQNKLGGSKRNINKHMKELKIDDGETVERADIERFFYTLIAKKRTSRTP